MATSPLTGTAKVDTTLNRVCPTSKHCARPNKFRAFSIQLSAQQKPNSLIQIKADPAVHFARRFPPPWTVEDTGACFVVKDGGGQELGYFYSEEEPGRQSAPAREVPTACNSRGISANPIFRPTI